MLSVCSRESTLSFVAYIPQEKMYSPNTLGHVLCYIQAQLIPVQLHWANTTSNPIYPNDIYLHSVHVH